VCVRSCSHLFVILVLFFFFVILEQKEEVLKKQRAEKEKLKAFREKVSIRLYCTHWTLLQNLFVKNTTLVLG